MVQFINPAVFESGLSYLTGKALTGCICKNPPADMTGVQNLSSAGGNRVTDQVAAGTIASVDQGQAPGSREIVVAPFTCTGAAAEGAGPFYVVLHDGAEILLIVEEQTLEFINVSGVVSVPELRLTFNQPLSS